MALKSSLQTQSQHDVPLHFSYFLFFLLTSQQSYRLHPAAGAHAPILFFPPARFFPETKQSAVV